ncbi:MAG TPA: flagellar biosynthetic protein FliR [Myxococcales bacterium LLY-WYZ-16_1]|nr:flagellar biosynthetic protein FliR [Myxococcales bacterium LLY-WYZ-16_1]
MPSGLYQIVGWGEFLNAILLPAGLILVRVLPIIFITPFLGGKLVPPETRIGLSIGMTMLVFPFATSTMVTELNLTGPVFIVLLFKEMFIGFVIGFIATELFYAMEIGGRALDVMRGSNQAEVQVPELQLRASPVGQFAFQLLLVIFCTMNGHVYFIESVIESFRMVPVDQFPEFTRGFDEFVDQILRYSAGLFAIAFALVFPGLFASFLVDIVFGMFNRIAPQLNAYFMALGVKASAGLVMLFFSLTLMMDQMEVLLQDSLVFVRKLVGALG